VAAVKKHASVRAGGLMSGTSCDGVDAAMLVSDGVREIEFVSAHTLPYAESLRQRLLTASAQEVTLRELLRMERDLTVLHAKSIAALCERSGCAIDDVEVIGFHGHTVRHFPDEGLTWQIGNASLLAELTGAPTVFDFRRRDMAAGGEGAPLAPLYHAALFRDDPKPVVVVNIGGVANVTWLGSGGEIIAGDAGPGCGLLDRWTHETTSQPFDRDGVLAASGRVDSATVNAAISTEFSQRPFPKSADRFQFDFDVSHLNSADGAATLCAVTAEAIRQAIQRLPAPPERTWVTGGGARHPVIMRLLAAGLPNVADIRDRGFRPDSMEAECFAWLAIRRLKGFATSLPTTTGARHETIGGLLTD
jgi:anhydro-N-acetylmuramic acid kinase